MHPSRRCMWREAKAANVHVCDGRECVHMCVLAWRSCVCLRGRSNRGITWVWSSSLGGGGGEKRDAWRKNGCSGGCRFIFSCRFLIHIFLHMSGGKGVSVCLVSICMHGTISLIHGVKPLSHPVMDVRFYSYFHDGSSALVSFQWLHVQYIPASPQAYCCTWSSV